MRSLLTHASVFTIYIMNTEDESRKTIDRILIQVGDKYGFRTCDSKCYDAQEIDCDCVCSGKNHGQGFRYALISTVKRKDLYEKMYGRKLSYGEEVMARIMDFK